MLSTRTAATTTTTTTVVVSVRDALNKDDDNKDRKIVVAVTDSLDKNSGDKSDGNDARDACETAAAASEPHAECPCPRLQWTCKS